VLLELVVDCAVLHGRGAAAHWLQEAAGVAADGKVGPATIAAVNAAKPLALYLRICATRWRFMGADVGSRSGAGQIHSRLVQSRRRIPRPGRAIAEIHMQPKITNGAAINRRRRPIDACPYKMR
jgi:lysozyme family protein